MSAGTDQVVLPALGGVLGVPLLLLGASRRGGTRGVPVAVPRIVPSGPASSSHSGKLKQDEGLGRDTNIFITSEQTTRNRRRDTVRRRGHNTRCVTFTSSSSSGGRAETCCEDKNKRLTGTYKSSASSSVCTVALELSGAPVPRAAVVPRRISGLAEALLRVLHPLPQVLLPFERGRVEGLRGGGGGGGMRAFPLLLTLSVRKTLVVMVTGFTPAERLKTFHLVAEVV